MIVRRYDHGSLNDLGKYVEYKDVAWRKDLENIPHGTVVLRLKDQSYVLAYKWTDGRMTSRALGMWWTFEEIDSWQPIVD